MAWVDNLFTILQKQVAHNFYSWCVSDRLTHPRMVLNSTGSKVGPYSLFYEYQFIIFFEYRCSFFLCFFSGSLKTPRDWSNIQIMTTGWRLIWHHFRVNQRKLPPQNHQNVTKCKVISYTEYFILNKLSHTFISFELIDYKF